jgi:hypothetical protein
MVAQDLRVFPRLGRLFASLQVRSMLIMMWVRITTQNLGLTHDCSISTMLPSKNTFVQKNHGTTTTQQAKEITRAATVRRGEDGQSRKAEVVVGLESLYGTPVRYL